MSKRVVHPDEMKVSVVVRRAEENRRRWAATSRAESVVPLGFVIATGYRRGANPATAAARAAGDAVTAVLSACRRRSGLD